MEVDRRAFIASLGGVAAVNLMDHEAKAEALEHYMEDKLDEMVAAQQPEKFPTVAEIEAQITTRPYRRGAGSVFTGQRGENVKLIEPMPAKPTLNDFFRLRFAPANHVLQSATRAMKTGMSQEIIACLLRLRAVADQAGSRLVSAAVRAHIPEKSAFAIRHHQTLRFYADDDAGTVPGSCTGSSATTISRQHRGHLQDAQNHKWHEPRLVTVNDRRVRSERQGIDRAVPGHHRPPLSNRRYSSYDNSPSAHMWWTLPGPDNHLGPRASWLRLGQWLMVKHSSPFLLSVCWRSWLRARPPARLNHFLDWMPRSPRPNTRRAHRCAIVLPVRTPSTPSPGRASSSRW
jgi:hypothetical protein